MSTSGEMRAKTLAATSATLEIAAVQKNPDRVRYVRFANRYAFQHGGRDHGHAANCKSLRRGNVRLIS